MSRQPGTTITNNFVDGVGHDDFQVSNGIYLDEATAEVHAHANVVLNAHNWLSIWYTTQHNNVVTFNVADRDRAQCPVNQFKSTELCNVNGTVVGPATTAATGSSWRATCTWRASAPACASMPRPRARRADARTMRAAASAFGVARARARGGRRDRRRALRQRLPRPPRRRCRGARRARRRRSPRRSSHWTCRAAWTAPAGRVDGTAIRAALTLAFHGRTIGTAIEPGPGLRGRRDRAADRPADRPRRPGARAAHGARRPRARAAALADGLEVRRRRRARRRRLARHERRAGAGRARRLPRGGGRRLGLRARERARGRRRARARADGARRAGTGARARARRPRRRRRGRARASGAHPRPTALVDALVRGVEAPLVLDADALFALAGRLETLRGARAGRRR